MSLFFRKSTEVISATVRHECQSRKMLCYGAYGAQGVGKRENQEDSFVIVNDMDVVAIKNGGLLAAVADGMGGMANGELASGTAIEAMRNAFERMDMKQDVTNQLLDALLAANSAVYSAIGAHGGCTMIACIFFDEKLYCVSVGDSAVYLFRGGQLSQINKEQNLLQEEYIKTIRSGSVRPECARAANDKEAITQFIGMKALDDIDMLKRPLPLHNEDVILICSDGVSGTVPESKIADCLSAGSARDMYSRLEEEIVVANKKYQDNYTAVVIQCKYS